MHRHQLIKEIHAGVLCVREEKYLKQMSVGDQDRQCDSDQGDHG